VLEELDKVKGHCKDFEMKNSALQMKNDALQTEIEALQQHLKVSVLLARVKMNATR